MPRNTDRPLTPKEQKFIRFYVKPGVRDLEKAAQLAGMKGREGKVLYNRPEVREDIDRRLLMIQQEQAKLDAKEEVLSDTALDHALAAMVGLDAKEHGGTKLAAITLGLVVKGRIETRHAKAVQRAGVGRPSIYGYIMASAPGGVVAALPAPAATPATTTTVRRTEEVIRSHVPPPIFEVIEHPDQK